MFGRCLARLQKAQEIAVFCRKQGLFLGSGIGLGPEIEWLPVFRGRNAEGQLAAIWKERR